MFTERIEVTTKVPKEAEMGKWVNLECTWKLSGNSNTSLYSVKWYKDEYEFFSYMPDNEPANKMKAHPVNGVVVDVSFSFNFFPNIL